MAASYNDSYLLSNDSAFIGRVQQSLIKAVIAISNEGFAVAFHRERQIQCINILLNPTGQRVLYANAVATDATVLSDATQAGTVVLTTANTPAQAGLVTDAHIDTAISSQFNSFIRVPSS